MGTVTHHSLFKDGSLSSTIDLSCSDVIMIMCGHFFASKGYFEIRETQMRDDQQIWQLYLLISSGTAN